MSRISTSLASFSWARSAIRRACSSDVRWSNAPGSLGIRVSPVEPSPLDFPGAPRPEPSRRRLAAADAGADLAGGDSAAGIVEELDPLRTLELRENGLERLGRVPRPGRDAEPRQPQHLVGLLPGWKRGELVGADEEDRVGEPLLRECVDGAARALRGRPPCSAGPRTRGGRACSARSKSSSTALCPGSTTTSTNRCSRSKCSSARLGERDVTVVRRIERRRRRARSLVLHRRRPGLARPAARSALVRVAWPPAPGSPRPCGTCGTDAVARAAAGRRGSPRPSSLVRGAGGTFGNELEQRSPQLLDARSGRSRRRDDGEHALILELERGGSATRSILFRTTIWGARPARRRTPRAPGRSRRSAPARPRAPR